MNPVIEVKNLVKSYGKAEAVRGVSFDVQEGEIFGLLGPNGAGKTTTLEILEGLKKSDKGSVKMLAKDEIGIVLQQSGFFPDLTIWELLKLFASFYSRAQKLDALVEKFNLKTILDRKFPELSGGQRQRFVLAIALLPKPRLVFLDEPTIGLDPAVRQNFWEIILNMRKSGITVLITTHYMEEAEIVCDRVGIMDQGKIVACERPVKLINSLGVVSHIKFMSSKPIHLGELEALSGVTSARRDRYTYDLETEAPEACLRELLEWEKNYSGKIFNLQVKQATLEDVFLRLTGHALNE